MNVAFRSAAAAAIVALALLITPCSFAADSAKLNSDARAALSRLYASAPAAKELEGKAVAVLVFPSITKGGIGVGGQYGDGVLLKRGKTVAYYNTAGVAGGLQFGAQRYGYAMFFMNDAAVAQLDKTRGFEVGVGPSVVVMEEGMAKSTSTTTIKADIYAFTFGQKGLMAGVGIQGNKITRLNK